MSRSVFVAVHDGLSGQDVRVFATKQQANKWREEIAEKEFDNDFPGIPRSDINNITEFYWEEMSGEMVNFTVYYVSIEEKV